MCWGASAVSVVVYMGVLPPVALVATPKAARLVLIPPQCGFHPSRFSAAEFANAPLGLAGAYLGSLTRGL